MNLQEIFIKNKCDKATKHRYYELYQQDFDTFKNDNINILEIGTFKGESTQSWLDYFSQAKIFAKSGQNLPQHCRKTIVGQF